MAEVGTFIHVERFLANNTNKMDYNVRFIQETITTNTMDVTGMVYMSQGSSGV